MEFGASLQSSMPSQFATIFRRGLFFVAPTALVLSLCFWWFTHSSPPADRARIICEALIREGGTYALLALAASLVLSCGYVDLSQTGMLAFCGVVFATVTQFGDPNIATLLAISSGAVFGLLIGLCVSRQMDALILTWAIGSILVLVTVAFGGSGVIRGRETSIDLGFIPKPGLWEFFHPAFNWAFLILLGVLALLRYSNLPRHCCAVGANSESARFAGVNVSATIIKAYAIAGTLVGGAAVLACYRESSAQTVRAESVELVSIAIAVLGGTSMKGGQLSTIAVVCAAGLWVSIRQQLVPLTFSWVDPGQNQRITQGLFSLLLVLCLVVGKLIWRERTRVIRVID